MPAGTTRGGRVESVLAGSPAAEAGIKSGDLILWLNGHPLHDVIDYQFYLEPDFQELEVERDGRMLTVALACEIGEDLGIRFNEALFDRVRTCRCNCVFCFVDQLPRGLRKSLYLKDDDFRLSFLHGNFITLHNLAEEDLERIAEQRLSPLYASVHATDPGMRATVMGCTEDDASRGLENLRRLGEAGITVHAQIVVCPGLNDGQQLARTVKELAKEYPAVASAGAVPVAFDPAFLAGNAAGAKPASCRALFSSLRPVGGDDCRRIVADVTGWQTGYRDSRGNSFIYCADEFYLKGGLELPSLDDYDDLPQYENGIGIAASFRAEAGELLAPVIEGLPDGTRVFLLTGTLAAGLMAEVCAGLAHTSGARSLSLKPLVAENRLFGPYVTVAGLLGGHDVIEAARSEGLASGDLLIIPRSCLDAGHWPRFLDGLHLKELREALECDVQLA